MVWSCGPPFGKSAGGGAALSLVSGLHSRALRLMTITYTKTSMDFITWLVVGLVAGVLASLVMGGGYGLIGDIVIGIVGAFIGGWIFRQLGVHSPISGLGGTIFIAFIGAVVLLFLLRLIHRGRGKV